MTTAKPTSSMLEAQLFKRLGKASAMRSVGYESMLKAWFGSTSKSMAEMHQRARRNADSLLLVHLVARADISRDVYGCITL